MPSLMLHLGPRLMLGHAETNPLLLVGGQVLRNAIFFTL
jgi:hypothetical protein